MNSNIPRYSLYGDEKRGSDPNFVHSQTLFSDIERQDWQIAPHRHAGLHQLVFLHSGSLEATLDGETLALTGPVLVSIPTDCVHGFGYSPRVTGRIVTIAEVFLRALIGDDEHSSVFSWLKRPCVIDLSSDTKNTVELLNRYITLIETELIGIDMGRTHSIGSAITLLLVAIGRAYAADKIEREHEILHSYQRVMSRFHHIVSQHLHEQWDINQYCNALGVTRKQLGRICHLLIGQSPLSFVHTQLTSEAQRRLIYTNASVTEVSFDLGFKDPSYFSRFFRRRTGESPRDFVGTYRHV